MRKYNKALILLTILIVVIWAILITIKEINKMVTIYVITATYERPEQIAELTRMSQTLMHVRDLHWLVIEDAHYKTPLVADLLKKTGMKYNHLIAAMPDRYKKRNMKPRGVSNRNAGLEWIRCKARTQYIYGVIYFADDDNTYDLQLFDEIRRTKKVSMFPVGLVTKTGLSTPVVSNGKLTGFYDGWIGGRKFPVDMAGFAVSVDFLLNRPYAAMPYIPGYEEDGFLQSLRPFEVQDIEMLADHCTKVKENFITNYTGAYSIHMQRMRRYDSLRQNLNI